MRTSQLSKHVFVFSSGTSVPADARDYLSKWEKRIEANLDRLPWRRKIAVPRGTPFKKKSRSMLEIEFFVDHIRNKFEILIAILTNHGFFSSSKPTGISKWWDTQKSLEAETDIHSFS